MIKESRGNMERVNDLNKYTIPLEKLRWICPQKIFQFECTTDIPPLKEFIGQDRAIDSKNFGLPVERSGYNLFLIGLTGDQGVMIPYKNVRNLMLREDVIKAVQEGQFHIYQVKTIDEGIEVLTGVSAGERQADGTYPEGTVNYRVDKSLREFAEKLKGYQAPASETV